jgi:glycosyltransferase involved in cell wall biosynthesis
MISILLPFGNAVTTILPCLASIRAQTMGNFEILGIDDHSNDGTRNAVELWPDHRIRLLTNPGLGLVDALNYGLQQAGYPLIARMDADDLMRSQRLQAQFSMLESDHQLSLVGSRVALFPQAAIQKGYREYVRWQNNVTGKTEIVNQRFVESPLAHPAVMFRKQAILEAGGYMKGDFPEDYELWLRLIQHGYKIAKHTDVLLDWRESTGRLSRTHPAYRREAFDRLRARYLEQLPVLKQRPVAFWGAGRKTRQRAGHLVKKGIEPRVWIDIDPKKIGNRIKGVAVVSPEFLKNHPQPAKPFVLVYVTNHGAREMIEVELESYGYRKGEDFLSVG